MVEPLKNETAWSSSAGATRRDPRAPGDDGAEPDDPRALLLPLLVVSSKNDRAAMVDERWRPRHGNEVIMLVDRTREGAARDWLDAGGWTLVPETLADGGGSTSPPAT
ncbi:MAG TPA: hypothetical protein VGP07_20370 [Polyangia bacterium]